MAVIKNNRVLKCLLMMVVSLLLVFKFTIWVSASSGYNRQEADACITISERLSVKDGSGADDIIQYERLKSQYVAEEIYNADRVGSALKDAPAHRAASYLSQEQLAKGRTYIYRGGDNRIYKLLQTEGQLNDVDGIYVYVINDTGQVTHQRFIQGGKYTGFPNQKVPKGGY